MEATKPYVRTVIANVLENGLPSGVCLNVNIPANDLVPYKGLKVCRQAIGNWVEEFDSRIDPYGRPYYWLTGKYELYDQGSDTDIAALREGYVSVVPVSVDLTAHESLATLNQWNFEI
jgi:5'-nucleotidase